MSGTGEMNVLSYHDTATVLIGAFIRSLQGGWGEVYTVTIPAAIILTDFCDYMYVATICPPTQAPPPQGAGKTSFSQAMLNSQASQDANQQPLTQHTLTQHTLTMTQPTQPLSQSELSQVTMDTEL